MKKSVSPKYTLMALIVNPNPLGPLLIMIGGLREFIRGEMSLHGEASLLLAVLLPPGL